MEEPGSKLVELEHSIFFGFVGLTSSAQLMKLKTSFDTQIGPGAVPLTVTPSLQVSLALRFFACGSLMWEAGQCEPARVAHWPAHSKPNKMLRTIMRMGESPRILKK